MKKLTFSLCLFALASVWGGSNAQAAVTLTLVPSASSVALGGNLTLTATVSGTTNLGLTWSVNGVTNGNSTQGTLTACTTTAPLTCKYTAPTVDVPSPNPVTFKIVSAASTSVTKTATATVTDSIAVTLTPASASVALSGTQVLTATLSGTTNTTLDWYVNGVLNGNSTQGTLTACTTTGTRTCKYTAPAVSVPSPNPAVIEVASAADPAKNKTAKVTVTDSIAVTLTPATANVALSGTQVFTATISGTADTTLNWYVNGVLNGNATEGTLTSCTTSSPLTCKYTAPPVDVPGPNPAVIEVASAADPSKNKSAKLTVTDSIAVTLTPATATPALTGTQVFTATISGTTNTALNWYVNGILDGNATQGTLTSCTTVAPWKCTYTAVNVPNPNPAVVKVASAADPSKNKTASVTVAGGFLYATGSLPVGGGYATLTVLNNGMALIAGGYSGAYIGDAELYNPSTETFPSTGSLNTPRYADTATLLNNGMVLIAGGLGASGVLAEAELYNPATGTFTPTGSLHTAREWHTATLLASGKVLVAGGSSGTAALASAELYDPTTGTFALAGTLHTARSQHTATPLPSGMVLLAGGNTASGASDSAELYNPATGTFTATGSLGTARYFHTATLLDDGLVLVAGGAGSSGPVAEAELFNSASGTFTSTGSMTAGRELPTATLLNNGMVLVAAGFGDSGALATAEVYNPATGAFTLTGNLHAARYYFAGTRLDNGMVLVAGGFGPGGIIASAELYQPATMTPPGLESIEVTPATPTLSPGTTQQFIATGTFSSGPAEQLASVTWSSSSTSAAQISNDASNNGQALAIAHGTATIKATAGSVSGSTSLTVRSTGFVDTGSMTTGRYVQTATLLNDGTVLVAGGDLGAGVPTADAELYNPATGTFGLTASAMKTARYLHAATLLPNGMVLITGGLSSNPSTSYNTAELYNPATGTFTYTGNMHYARHYHTSTLLPNGQVLIAGGIGPSGTGGDLVIASAELYNPATGTFTVTGNLVDPRAIQTATLLNNGLVLIAGGLLPSGQAYYSSAELYDPATKTFSSTGSMNETRLAQTATLLPNGMVLMAGGAGSTSGSGSTAELYDPVTGKFTPTGSLSTGRESAAATLLNNGLVLVVGGAGPNPPVAVNELSEAELYNPATGTFTTTGSLNSAREEETATLLNNGMVLVVGGYNSLGNGLVSAELY